MVSLLVAAALWPLPLEHIPHGWSAPFLVPDWRSPAQIEQDRPREPVKRPGQFQDWATFA